MPYDRQPGSYDNNGNYLPDVAGNVPLSQLYPQITNQYGPEDSLFNDPAMGGGGQFYGSSQIPGVPDMFQPQSFGPADQVAGGFDPALLFNFVFMAFQWLRAHHP